MLPSTCNSHNAVKDIHCNGFLTICPDDKDFYFRLQTPGEVYTLGVRAADWDDYFIDLDPENYEVISGEDDYTANAIIPAPKGLVPCALINSDADIYIVNDNH